MGLNTTEDMGDDDWAWVGDVRIGGVVVKGYERRDGSRRFERDRGRICRSDSGLGEMSMAVGIRTEGGELGGERVREGERTREVRVETDKV